MITKTTFIAACALVSALIIAAPSQAEDQDKLQLFDIFLKELKAEIVEKDLPLDMFEASFTDGFYPRKEVQKQRRNAPEKRLDFQTYAQKLVSQWRVSRGIERYVRHRSELQRIGHRYSVDPSVIAALWGIETSYGNNMGDHMIIPALTTLAYHSHRKSFFRKELFAALKILKEGHVPVDKFKGSWAGAMGQCQFMPTSFLHYARDGDDDGRADIWSNTQDVFASAGNYLAMHKWNYGQIGMQRVILGQYLPADLKLNKHGISDKKTVKDWQNMGVYAARGTLMPPGETAALYIPDGPSGRAYLVYNNFFTIMRWNHSPLFAYSVLELARKIKEGANQPAL